MRTWPCTTTHVADCLTGQNLIYSDLDATADGMPKQYANVSKNNTIPNVAGGILWSDTVNKVFWLYGGEYYSAPSTFELWGYDTILNQWNQSSAPEDSTSTIKRVSYGAGTTIDKTGYYYGGYLNEKTNPQWSGPPLATSGLIRFNMDTNRLDNVTGPDSIGRAEGVMLSIPASAAGLLIYFGGVTFPYGNATEVPMPMSDVLIYDSKSEIQTKKSFVSSCGPLHAQIQRHRAWCFRGSATLYST